MRVIFSPLKIKATPLSKSISTLFYQPKLRVCYVEASPQVQQTSLGFLQINRLIPSRLLFLPHLKQQTLPTII